MRRRILVVDDEPGMLRAVGRILEGNHEVVCEASSTRALQRLETFEPDLAILDVRMPDVDGFELMARLKQRMPGVDVILMTGSVAESDQKLIRAIRQKAFYFIQKPFDREVLQTLVDRCLELRRLSEENLAHTARLEAELDQARIFQRSLMPPHHAKFGSTVVEARYVPCDELCGDLYDYVATGDGVSFLVADVSGHGASAAMLTGVVKSAFRAPQRERFEPDVVATTLATSMRGMMNNRFVTLFCGTLDAGGDRLEYVSAGHPHGILRAADGALTMLAPTGPIVSPALPDCVWRPHSIRFGPGDSLLLYTDGVTEAGGDAGDFGVERLCEATRAAPAGDLIRAALDAVRRFTAGRPPVDDLTMMTVARSPRPA